MGNLKKITAKLFGQKPLKGGNGLYATLDELMDMRRYVSYLQANRKQRTYSVQAGDIKSAFKGRGIEMEEIREYGFGDDVRDIDWRVTARKETPYTKVYLEERDYEIYVWLDLSPLMMFGSTVELKAVTAAKISALLGWVALHNKDRFGCVIFDGKQSLLFKPRNDRSYLAAILKKTASVSERALRQSQNTDAERKKSLKLLQANLKGKASVFLISSFNGWSEMFDSELAAIAKKSRAFLIDVFDKLEAQAPVSGQYMAEYNGEKLIIDSSAENYRNEYEAYFQQKRVQKENFCKQTGCKIVHFSPDMSIAGNLKIF